MKKRESKFNSIAHSRGFSILEPLLAASLIAILILGVVSALVSGRTTVAENASRAKALFLAEEGIEAVRSVRSEGFTGLEAGIHGLSQIGGVWSLDGESDTTDGFERTIEITDIDAASKSILSTVEWTSTFGPTSVSVETRLFDWQSE